MNRETRTEIRARRLAEVSRKVRAGSMRVNAEFVCPNASWPAWPRPSAKVHSLPEA